MSDDIQRGREGDARHGSRAAHTSGGMMQATGVQIGLLLLLVLVNLIVLWVLWSAINTA